VYWNRSTPGCATKQHSSSSSIKRETSHEYRSLPKISETFTTPSTIVSHNRTPLVPRTWRNHRTTGAHHTAHRSSPALPHAALQVTTEQYPTAARSHTALHNEISQKSTDLIPDDKNLSSYCPKSQKTKENTEKDMISSRGSSLHRLLIAID
jgi:hypothetical protein